MDGAGTLGASGSAASEAGGLAASSASTGSAGAASAKSTGGGAGGVGLAATVARGAVGLGAGGGLLNQRTEATLRAGMAGSGAAASAGVVSSEFGDTRVVAG